MFYTMKYVLCFGNPYIEDDNLITKIVKDWHLDGFSFVICTSPEELMLYAEKECIILDVAKGIEKPVIIDDRSSDDTFVVAINRGETMLAEEENRIVALLKQSGALDVTFKEIGV